MDGILAFKLSFVNLEFGLRHFSCPKGVDQWGRVGGGGWWRKPSGAGGESFQRGLEWRRALCKPFLDSKLIPSKWINSARINSFFQHWKYSRAIILPLTTFLEIYSHLIQSEHYFQSYFQLKRQIYPIFMEKLSNNPMVIHVQKKWTFLVESAS